MECNNRLFLVTTRNDVFLYDEQGFSDLLTISSPKAVQAIQVIGDTLTAQIPGTDSIGMWKTDGTSLGYARFRRPDDSTPQLTWERWGPLVAVLPGVRAWSDDDRRALATVIRAKGGRRESEFVHAFDAHAALRAAIVALSRGAPARNAGERRAAR